MIIDFLLFIVTFLIGYWLGHTTKPIEEVKTGLESLYHKVIPTPSLKPGILKRPSVKDLEKRNLPQAVKEANEAMLDALNKIPELQEMRKALGEHR